jgi:hypothetical protein
MEMIFKKSLAHGKAIHEMEFKVSADFREEALSFIMVKMDSEIQKINKKFSGNWTYEISNGHILFFRKSTNEKGETETHIPYAVGELIEIRRR